ncbi:MAG: VOC family protein [Chitinophagaceae bacterium]|nr:VOC family protein [Chitinophagaceae bacterium]MCB9046962.1 VOC family protein [Chitinophagales bacterium]
MNKITPFLWFDNNLEEAITFYTSVFKNAQVVNIHRQTPDGPAFTATFELEGQRFMGLNGGPMFKFTEAVSFFVHCKDQEEIDYFWESLTADGGEESMCGWLKDKYGLSWQIVPASLEQLLYHEDPEKSARAMQALLKMRKLDIATLQNA